MNQVDLQTAKALLLAHQVIGVSTDTVLGLATLIEDQHLIYQLKERDEHKPIIYLISSIAMIPNLDPRLRSHLSDVWPGNVSVIINNQGYRIPNHQPLLDLIDALGVPLAVSSANISGEVPLTSFLELDGVFNGLPVYGDDQHLSQIPSCVYRINPDLSYEQLR